MAETNHSDIPKLSFERAIDELETIVKRLEEGKVPLEESVAIWRNVRAPVMWVAASDSEIPRWLANHPEGEIGTDGMDAVRRRIAHIRNARLVTIDDAGHMLHHDQPAAVAAQIEPFLADRA